MVNRLGEKLAVQSVAMLAPMMVVPLAVLTVFQRVWLKVLQMADQMVVKLVVSKVV